MNKLWITAILLASTWIAAVPEENEPLDGAFLEYLANLEGDGDDWTLLTEAEEDPAEAQAKPAKPTQPSKEAAKPAEEER